MPHPTGSGRPLLRRLAEDRVVLFGWPAQVGLWQLWILMILGRLNSWISFFFSPCILIFSLRLWMILYIYSSCWAHRFMPQHFGEQLATDNKNTEAWKQMKNSWICRWFLNWWMCFFSFGKSIGDTFYLLLTPLNIFKEHLTDFPSWMMMMMIKLDFHILLRLAKTC